jgi:hypothetical protein
MESADWARAARATADAQPNNVIKSIMKDLRPMNTQLSREQLFVLRQYLKLYVYPKDWEKVEALFDMAQAWLEVQPKANLYRHKKTGGIYEKLLPMGHIQSSDPLYDMDAVAIYRGQDGKLWARKASEFQDGRFEPVTPESTP